jgi:hypothetical protein
MNLITKKQKSKKAIFHYKNYQFGLHPNTVELLKKEKQKSNLTWNRFFYKIINHYINTNR